MKIKIIAIASDHAGYNLKTKIIKYLKGKNFIVNDLGTDSEKSVDYPDYGHQLAREIEQNKADIGISLCGSGNGINMTMNKHKKIRSALCWSEEISSLARAHNDANNCALPARFIDYKEAILIINAFLTTDFEGGRHIARVNKIAY